MAGVRMRSLLPGERIRVLVVDDSVVIRRLVTVALEQDPELQVVGVASNGAIALQKIPLLSPDVLTLDIEMPVMNGLETLKTVRRDYPGTRVIMFSTLTERGASVTLEALSLGADDYVTKASNEGSLDRSMERLREELIPKIKQFFRGSAPASTNVQRTTPSPAASIHPPVAPLFHAAHSKARIVLIGSSTGGPTALSSVLPQFPADFPLPILVVQHMPPLFTRLLADRLGTTCKLSPAEASQGERVVKGRILIAPGDFHMKVANSGGDVHVVLDQSPPQNYCRPAVDALFLSAAEVYGGAVIAMVLTGMGQDGMRGSSALKAQGATILAQDQESSVVWGMPGAVVNAGLADCVLPINRCAEEIMRRVEKN